MLKSEFNLYVLLKRALYAEFYTKKDSKQLWADALKLKHALDHGDQEQVDCIVDKYDCELEQEDDSTDCNLAVDIIPQDVELSSPCENLKINIS